MGKTKQEKKIASEKRKQRRQAKQADSLVSQRDQALKQLQENLSWLNGAEAKENWGATPEEVVQKIRKEREDNSQEREVIDVLRGELIAAQAEFEKKDQALAKDRAVFDREVKNVLKLGETNVRIYDDLARERAFLRKEKEEFKEEKANFEKTKEEKKASSLQRRLKEKTEELKKMRAELHGWKKDYVPIVRTHQEENKALRKEVSDLKYYVAEANQKIRLLEEQILPSPIQKTKGGMLLSVPQSPLKASEEGEQGL